MNEKNKFWRNNFLINKTQSQSNTLKDIRINSKKIEKKKKIYNNIINSNNNK